MTTIFQARPSERPVAPAHAPTDDIGDGPLLDRFILEQDESAFAELVRRHSAMVLGVCRRVLNNAHDAEDCFQAVFMVLVRKATTIEPRGMVGNWLYGVAYRTALEARKLSARRRDMERKKSAQPPALSTHELWQELRPVLDQELSRLPDKYRAVVIACDLEGMTRQEAAEHLKLPEGTVASRLSRARAMLSKRLNKHAFSMTGNALALLLAEQASRDYVSASLLDSTVEAGAQLAAGRSPNGLVSHNAAALADRVIQGMANARGRIVAAVFFVLLSIGIGISTLMPAALAERKPDLEKPDSQKSISDPKKVKPELVKDCVIRHIDMIHRKMHTTGSGDDGSAICDVQITANTLILVDGRETQLADLTVGTTVNLEIRRRPNGLHQAVRIQTTGVELAGVVHAVTEDTVTVETESAVKEQSTQKTFDIKQGAWIYLNGKKAKLADLKPRMTANLKITHGKPVVVEIRAGGSKSSASIKKVDLDRQTVALQFDASPDATHQLVVAPNALVLVDGKGSRLADLSPDSRVKVQLASEMPGTTGAPLVLAISELKSEVSNPKSEGNPKSE